MASSDPGGVPSTLPTSIHASAHWWCIVFPPLNPNAKTYILKVTVILPKYHYSSFGLVPFFRLIYTISLPNNKVLKQLYLHQYFSFIVLCAIALPNEKYI